MRRWRRCGEHCENEMRRRREKRKRGEEERHRHQLSRGKVESGEAPRQRVT